MYVLTLCIFYTHAKCFLKNTYKNFMGLKIWSFFFKSHFRGHVYKFKILGEQTQISNLIKVSPLIPSFASACIDYSKQIPSSNILPDNLWMA